MDIKSIANKFGINDVVEYGSVLKTSVYDDYGKSKTVLVTATNPTKYGEGKTTVAIGLNDALNKLNRKSIAALREPSMGPVFGMKGGATGGGKALIIPENLINLHFTGDMHAITSANNLIAAMIDNEIYQGNKLDIKRVTFRRCLDVNDRALRTVTLDNGRVEHFNITAASEIMAIMCLSQNYADLRRRIGNIIIGYNSLDEEIYVSDLGIVDAVLSLLIEAFKPNLVNSLEDNLVFVHGGPFANIAHGCSSIISLKTASHYAEYTITEAGFGADAGAYKFMDIVSRNNITNLSCIVLVTTVRALKLNGEYSLEDGISNLDVHISNLRRMFPNVVVTINKFDDDTENDINYIMNYCNELDVPCVLNNVYQDGGEGALDLAKEVMKYEVSPVNYLYDVHDSLKDKIESYAKNISHASSVFYDEFVLDKIKKLDKYKYPICVAKTQYSISHDANLLGYPHDYELIVRDVEVQNGAEFIIVYLGKIITMPGLNANPSALEVKVVDEEIFLPR